MHPYTAAQRAQGNYDVNRAEVEAREDAEALDGTLVFVVQTALRRRPRGSLPLEAAPWQSDAWTDATIGLRSRVEAERILQIRLADAAHYPLPPFVRIVTREVQS
jgi:hypothetical protein